MKVKELKEYLKDKYDHKDIMLYLDINENNYQGDKVIDNSKNLLCYETVNCIVISNRKKAPKGAIDKEWGEWDGRSIVWKKL